MTHLLHLLICLSSEYDSPEEKLIFQDLSFDPYHSPGFMEPERQFYKDWNHRSGVTKV